MKTTGVKDVPKKILLVFLGHPKGHSPNVSKSIVQQAVDQKLDK